MDSVHDGSLMTTGPRWQKLGKERKCSWGIQSSSSRVSYRTWGATGNRCLVTNGQKPPRLASKREDGYSMILMPATRPWAVRQQIRDTCRISSGPHTPWAQKPGRKTVCADRQDTDFFLSDGVSFKAGCEKVCTVLPPFLPGRGGKRFVTTEAQKGA